MKTTQRTRRITVTDTVTLGVNAVVRRKVGNGYDTIYPASSNVQALTTTHTALDSEDGTHFILNSATGFVTTLPAPKAGAEYFFHVGATEPSSGNHTVVTNGSANIIVGNITSPDLNAVSDVATVTDADTISFVASTAVHGDYAHVWSDGTNWYLDGMCKAAAGMTTTQAS